MVVSILSEINFRFQNGPEDENFILHCVHDVHGLGGVWGSANDETAAQVQAGGRVLFRAGVRLHELLQQVLQCKVSQACRNTDL